MNMTRATLTAVLALAGALSFPQALRAEGTNAPASAETGTKDVQAAQRERLQRMAKEIGLTADQQQKLQALLRERMAKLDELRKNASLSAEEKAETIKTARAE